MSMQPLSDLERRVANMIVIGTIVEIDATSANVRVSIGGDAVTQMLPVIMPRAGSDVAYWMPTVGEQVVVLSPSGDTRQGAVLPSLYSGANPPPADRETMHRTVYSDGTVIEYDSSSHNLKADLQGTSVNINRSDVTVLRGGSSIVISDGEIQLNASSVSINGSSLTHNGTNVGDTHTHGGILVGSSSTDVPD